MTSNLHPTFAAILKPHLQGQTVVARKRDTIRFRALQRGWEECGDLISFGTFVAAVDTYEATRDEAHLDAQFKKEQQEKEAEREERRQEREWRNDSGV